MAAFAAPAMAAKKPSIVVIRGDDIGQGNISADIHGMMGYQTPNIDRLAKEGTMFTDYYAEQSVFTYGQQQGRAVWRQAGSERQGPDDCQTAEADGLRDRFDLTFTPLKTIEIPQQDIHKTRVLKTVLQGHTVYEAK